MMAIEDLKANSNYTACAAVLDFSRHSIEWLNKKYLETGNVEDFIERPKLTEVHKTFCEMFKLDNLKLWVFLDECAFQLFRNTHHGS